MTIIDAGLQATLPARISRAPGRCLIAMRSLTDGFVLAVTALLDWQERARERRLALGLSDVALKDIGASRADLERGF